ncbi:MAG: hypothetical protein ABI318_20355 [Chthoniobacteraceae bacterium]
MKILLLAFLSIVTTGLASASAQDNGSLPFPVSVGGQAATYNKGEAFAKLAKPVKNDAAIEVTAKADQMIIINVHKTDEKGTPTVGAQPAIIILQNTNKGTLAGTMDKQKLAAGNYLLSVIASGRTATILFKIE